MEAAVRVVETEFGLDIFLPSIHQLLGAPKGLVLYNEYPISPTEIRLSLVFLGKVNTNEVALGREYDDVLWMHSDQKLPRDILPQVRASFPYAAMAAGLVHGTR